MSIYSDLEYLYYRFRLSDVARAVQTRKLTYLSSQRLLSLQKWLRTIKRKGVKGDFVECGIALGGSAILIASELDGMRRFCGYDVFGMIPPPSAPDDPKSMQRYDVIKSGRAQGIGGGTYYGYLDNLYDRVRQSFESFGLPVDGNRISLKKGLFEDTLHFDPDEHVAFAHIDCDWYEPVKLSLNRIHPALSSAAVIILDDYNDWGGCRRATVEYLKAHPDVSIAAETPHAILIKA